MNRDRIARGLFTQRIGGEVLPAEGDAAGFGIDRCLHFRRGLTVDMEQLRACSEGLKRLGFERHVDRVRERQLFLTQVKRDIDRGKAGQIKAGPQGGLDRHLRCFLILRFADDQTHALRKDLIRIEDFHVYAGCAAPQRFRLG